MWKKYLYLVPSGIVSECRIKSCMRKYMSILVSRFAVIGAHIRPDSVEKELSEMVNVYQDVAERWKNVPVVIMGDFNAGSK